LKNEDVTWLEDSSLHLDVGGLKVGLVGSQGSLDRPTFWQRTRMKGIWRTYRQRVRLIDSLIHDLRADVKIVFTHYAPTYQTLLGEKERIWPEMGCRLFEEVIRRRQPDYWLHGHTHLGSKLEVEVGRTRVLNVSLPARRKITVITI
jgi:Icc-related predicted phosphoesterase